MLTCYKWTTPELETYNNTRWEPGVWQRKPDNAFVRTSSVQLIATRNVFHCYRTIVDALRHDPDRQLTLGQTQLWLAECENPVAEDYGITGVLGLRLLERVEEPCTMFYYLFSCRSRTFGDIIINRRPGVFPHNINGDLVTVSASGLFELYGEELTVGQYLATIDDTLNPEAVTEWIYKYGKWAPESGLRVPGSWVLMP